MQQVLSNNKLLAPLYFWLTYSLSTIVIFEFGPLQFQLENKIYLYLYLFSAHVSIILGYYSGFNKFKSLRQVKLNTKLISKKVLNVVSTVVLCGVIFAFIRDYLSGLSIVSAMEDPFKAREVYTQVRGGGILGYIGTILNILVIPYLAIATINFKRLNNFSKFVLIFLICRIAFDSVIGGSRHGLMMLIVVLFFSILSLIYTNQIKIRMKSFFIITLCSLTVFLFYSSSIAKDRQVNPINDYVEYMSNNSGYEFDKESIFIPKFSGDLQLANAGILTGYFYFTHAYRGLSNALNLPFKGSTLFFGHSDFSIRNLARIFGDDVLDYSYHYRLINENLGAKTLWITAYAWIASDVTFIGSLFLLYFFGSLFSKSWILVLTNPTMISSSLLAWMAYFFFQINITFVPSDLGAFVSFWGVIILYKFKIRSKSNE